MIGGMAVVVLTAAVLAMQAWRLVDDREAVRAWRSLRKHATRPRPVFDPLTVENLPEAARRYFRFTIKSGTPLSNVAELRMAGELGLGSKAKPGYLPMRASQILAPPFGFVWKVQAGRGLLRVSGSDGLCEGRSWTRFWLLNLIPVARVGGSHDHLLASFGRIVAEAAFWAPASLLPGEHVVWQSVSHNRAKAIVTNGALVQDVEIEVAPDGRPLSVVIQRWSNSNAQKVWKSQPFGGTLADFKEFYGYRIPTRVDGGNHFGTDNYFPFFRAQVEDIAFLEHEAG